jgi:ribulose-5-phosphate 4-epimerase/fuculose-1-phosphate aldolase
LIKILNNEFKKTNNKISKKLNSTNLSALRSGNISARGKNKGVDGFYITPSGMRYSSLKPKILFS